MRARSLKPGLFKNEQLGTAEPLYTVIFEGLWTLADREGRLEDRPLRIHAEINPYRPGFGTAQALDWLCANGFIVRYQVNGAGYIWIPTFLDHQNPHVREPPSKLPSPEKAQTDQGNGEAPVLHGASTSLAPVLHQSRPSDSGLPFPDSGLLTPPSSTSVSSKPPSRFVAQERDGSVIRIFEFWKATWNHPRARLDTKRRRVIAQALKAYTEGDLRICIAGYLNSSHHCGENDRRAVYDDIGLFLRDAARIDAGIAFGQDRHPAKPELTLRNEAEFSAYRAATQQGLSFASQDEWEAHYRGRQTH